jgi:1-acyl-sn-glycerol-3-phosphate acyltransferase
MLLHRAAFDVRPGYGPIDAAMLGKYRFFERLGAFGVEQGTRRGAARFLRVGRAILEAPGSVLWITAEGRFRDPRERPVRFAPGLGHLLRSATGVTVVPLAVEYPFWTERQPEVAVRFGDPIDVDRGDVRTAAGWTAVLERRLEATLDRLAEDTAARDPERFDVLVRGRAGVGLVYDLWRRLRARVTGTTYEAAHLDRS